MVKLATSLNLAVDLGAPFVWDMAIRAARTHTAAVHVMDGLFVFWVDVVCHFVAANTEFGRVGGLKGGVEATPKQNADHKRHAADGQNGMKLETGLITEEQFEAQETKLLDRLDELDLQRQEQAADGADEDDDDEDNEDEEDEDDEEEDDDEEVDEEDDDEDDEDNGSRSTHDPKRT